MSEEQTLSYAGPRPPRPFNCDDPDNEVRFFRGPVGVYGAGILAARAFVDIGFADKRVSVFAGIETDDGRAWRRPYVETIAVSEAIGSEDPVVKGWRRAEVLWKWLWGLMRIGYIEGTADGETWTRLSQFESFSKNDDGHNWLCPMPTAQGTWRSERMRLLGLREGIDLTPPGPTGYQAPISDIHTVYCTVCSKTHGAAVGEELCGPGAWLYYDEGAKVRVDANGRLAP